MNAELVEQIANAVLYEGYMLYPYRPSAVKNRQRWNFGVVYPKKYSELQKGADAWRTQTQCLVRGAARAKITVKLRFLQTIARVIGEIEAPVDELAGDTEPNFRPVEVLRVGEQLLQTWQESIEREIVLPDCLIDDCATAAITKEFSFPAASDTEGVRGPEGRIAALIVRKREAIRGVIKISAEALPERLFKVTVRILNVTPARDCDPTSRDEILLRSLVSAHSILRADGGEFVSLLDPPECCKELAAGCENIGTWPVLVGEEGTRDAMLSSPIILYDYPQIAPESAGDLFDGTEIDEILALRIMTLTDDEKREMRQSDARAREILERTECLPAEQLMKLHGTLRGLRPPIEEQR